MPTVRNLMSPAHPAARRAASTSRESFPPDRLTTGVATVVDAIVPACSTSACAASSSASSTPMDENAPTSHGVVPTSRTGTVPGATLTAELAGRSSTPLTEVLVASKNACIAIQACASTSGSQSPYRPMAARGARFDTAQTSPPRARWTCPVPVASVVTNPRPPVLIDTAEKLPVSASRIFAGSADTSPVCARDAAVSQDVRDHALPARASTPRSVACTWRPPTFSVADSQVHRRQPPASSAHSAASATWRRTFGAAARTRASRAAASRPATPGPLSNR
jgi:hypothetical protein